MEGMGIRDIDRQDVVDRGLIQDGDVLVYHRQLHESVQHVS